MGISTIFQCDKDFCIVVVYLVLNLKRIIHVKSTVSLQIVLKTLSWILWHYQKSYLVSWQGELIFWKDFSIKLMALKIFLFVFLLSHLVVRIVKNQHCTQIRRIGSQRNFREKQSWDGKHLLKSPLLYMC